MAEDVVRVNYFKYQFLNAEDLLAEQAYHRRMRGELTLAHFGTGIVRGLEVEPIDRTSVRVFPGYAVDATGRALVVTDERTVSLTGLTAGSSGTVYVAYDQRQDGPTRVGDETMYTRWRESPTVDVTTQPGPGQVPLATVTRRADADPALDTAARTMVGPVIPPVWIGGEHVRPGSIRHSQLVLDGGTNPHRTTAADVGSLPLSGGGTVTGQLSVATTGSSGWQQAVTAYASGPVDATAIALTGVANTDGDGQKVGLDASASGALGPKFAVRAFAQTAGDGPAFGGAFTASGNGQGSKLGLSVSASGDLGQKQGLTASAHTPGADSAIGASVFATGDGTGPKTGLFSVVSGTLGPKLGLQVLADTGGDDSAVGADITAYGDGQGWKQGLTVSTRGAGPKTALSAFAEGGGDHSVTGAHISVWGAGTGYKTGLGVHAYGPGPKSAVSATAEAPADDEATAAQLSAYGDGVGTKRGLSVAVSGARGSKVGLQCFASTPGAEEAAAIQAWTSSEGTGPAYGVVASTYGQGSGSKFGIYASASGAGQLWAGFFDGPVYVGGALTKAGGGFLIDHPLDPDNRTLRHDFVESPEALCLYRGQVTLGEHGRATVSMPAYFAALTDEARATVHLTAVTTEPFTPVYEWNSEHDAITVVGRANARVDYLVLAERDDAAHHAMARPVEEDKGEKNVVGRGVRLGRSGGTVPAPGAGVEPGLAAERAAVRRPSTPGELGLPTEQHVPPIPPIPPIPPTPPMSSRPVPGWGPGPEPGREPARPPTGSGAQAPVTVVREEATDGRRPTHEEET